MNSDLVSVSDSGSASSDSDRLCLESLASEVLPFVYVSASRSCHLSTCRLHVVNPKKVEKRIEVKLGARAATSGCEESK
jgi:hypothetical protein